MRRSEHWISLYESDLTARLEFARRAAQHFAAHPEHSSFGDLTPGSLLALRWGLGDDCVLTLKLDEADTPMNFMEIVRNARIERRVEHALDEIQEESREKGGEP